MDQHGSPGTVAIIGAGLGGIALVANLGLQGYRLRLHDVDDARIAKVRERGGLDVEGLVQGFAPLELVTPRLAPAMEGADVIIVVTGSHFHADVARSSRRTTSEPPVPPWMSRIVWPSRSTAARPRATSAWK